MDTPAETSQRKPWSRRKRILLGCAVFLPCVPLFALVVVLLLASAELRQKIDSMQVRDEVVFNDPEAVGNGGAVQQKIRSSGHYGGEAIYDVVYTLDGFGRRVTPVQGSEQRTRFMAFFGCSFVYGHGVNDNETLPYYVGELCSQYRPYNYGLRGQSPQRIMEYIQQGRLGEEITEREGIAVYAYIPHHLDRVIGAMPCFNAWIAEHPYYFLDEAGRLVHGGTFRTGRPWRSRLYDALWDWPVLNWFSFTLPTKRTREDIDLLTAIICASKMSFEQQFPGCPFVFLYFYRNLADPAIKWDDYLRESVESKGVQFIDATAWQTEEILTKYLLPDYHPKPVMHKRVAQELVHGLGLCSAAGPSH